MAENPRAHTWWLIPPRLRWSAMFPYGRWYCLACGLMYQNRVTDRRYVCPEATAGPNWVGEGGYG